MMEAGILPLFKGVAVHDHWVPYYRFTNLSHSLCNAHLLRELRYFEEATGHHWPIRLREILVEGKKAVEAGRKGRVRQEPATNLLRRFRDFRTEVWRFIDDFRVPFDNNPAERLVRPVKVKLKVAGGFRAVGGSSSFCVIRSVWQTHKLQGINPFHTLRIAFSEG